jgi:hypothetical protein
MEGEEKFDLRAADDFADRFHDALAAGTFERIAAPKLEDEVVRDSR